MDDLAELKAWSEGVEIRPDWRSKIVSMIQRLEEAEGALKSAIMAIDGEGDHADLVAVARANLTKHSAENSK